MNVAVFLKSNVKEPHIFEDVKTVSDSRHFYTMRKLTDDGKLEDIKYPVEDIFMVREYRDRTKK